MRAHKGIEENKCRMSNWRKGSLRCSRILLYFGWDDENDLIGVKEELRCNYLLPNFR